MAELLLLILMGLFVFMGVRFIQARPDLFRAEVLSKAIGTLGFLALGLVILISIGVLILEAS